MNNQDHKEHNQPNHQENHEDHTAHLDGADSKQHNGDHQSGHGDHGTDHSGHEQLFRTRFWWCLVLTIPVLLYSEMLQRWFGYTMPTFPGSTWIPVIFSLIIFGYGGVPFLQMAVPEIRSRKPGMMTLISLAISVALIYSLYAQFTDLGEVFFWELVTLIDIMLLGHWLEMRSIRKASGALDELAKLMPDEAERITSDGSIETVSTEELQKGDRLLIRPGASVPADGEVIEGESSLDESMITGESRPVDKKPGSKVIAGTINGDGSLRVKVSAIGDETALAGIMRLVEQAQGSKSQTQKLADRAAGWLFYIALGVAALTLMGWIIAIGFDSEVLKRVVTVLVIACPHALGLAVPLVVAITTALGANNGILVRDRLALELARQIDTVVFDKTGTLTEGKFGVVDLKVTADWREADALALAAVIEGDSEHPIAQAIRSAADQRELELPEISGFSALKGRGVKAQYQDSSVFVGGPQLLEELNVSPSDELTAFSKSASERVHSVVYLTENEGIIAAFAVADVIRPESHEAIERLHGLGIEVAMLTGDSQSVAEAVAAELGIDQIFAEVLPEDKDQKIITLQEKGKRVAMVGDGVNDAPALTRADVGIAIGGGTDVAIESAGLILVRSNPLDVVKIFTLSQASYRKMIQNLWWAAGYNIIALPLAAGVLAPWGILLSPAVGAGLMSLSTIIVAINAQFLRRTTLTD